MYTPRTVIRHADALWTRSGACPFPIDELLYEHGWTGRMTGWGAWRNTRCPFHHDRHPSASVNLEINAFKCWSCGMQGDTVSLLAELEGITREQAREQLRVHDTHPAPRPSRPEFPWR